MNKQINLESYKGMDIATAMFGVYLPDNIEGTNIHVMTADMSVASCLERIKLQFPEKYTDVGIAEQNMIGIAAGLASEGYLPISVCQAAFISMRAFEMNRQLIGYMHNKVILVGLHAGFFLQFMGNTHYAVEDIAIMRTIPGMIILSPADAGEAVMALRAAIDCKEPVYIRLTGGSAAPTVYSETCPFNIGKNIILKEGADITIFATGAMVGFSLQAADILKNKFDIDAKVIDAHTIKPLDKKSIDSSKSHKLIVTVEEHSIVGGLGSAVAEHISEIGGFPPLLKLGVKDKFSQVGDYNFLLSQHRLTPECIAEDIVARMKGL